MAQKIEGWTTPKHGKAIGAYVMHVGPAHYSGDVHATLVIHSGPSQPVFTEDEVKAMINDLIEQRYDDGSNWSVTTDAIVTITAKHGVNP